MEDLLGSTSCITTSNSSEQENRYVAAVPYQWPYHGVLAPSNTCLVVIDMQIDFCGKGGYMDQLGYDLTPMRAIIRPISRVLDCMRTKGYLIIHTRETYRPDLADCPPARLWRTQQAGAGIGSKVGSDGSGLLIQGEPGWDIIPELKPLENESVIDKPARGAFVGTSLDLILRNKGIQNLILCGVTTDVCVHSTMRHADDLGFECLLLEDCCAASKPSNHKAAIEMVKEEGGVFGAVADSSQLVLALES
ncbi:amidohydrolase RutB [Seminavis robusta]|uniref:Amidohydrolase RutB n=1 Tax=Seminavis robusta TaxID=568900 RepID=A0A9N8ETC2_9STRA|nr:amidohydrolase RutB [Seminavis robusta]|eukprot:Sro2065_g313230.1 amidohydrolase RutB (249) ;mRNA; f:14563-15601